MAVLLGLSGGGLAHFELAPGRTPGRRFSDLAPDVSTIRRDAFRA